MLRWTLEALPNEKELSSGRGDARREHADGKDGSEVRAAEGGPSER